MFAELIAVPGDRPNAVTWHVLVTEPYIWRVEFACVSESAATALRLALDGVSGAILEPAE